MTPSKQRIAKAFSKQLDFYQTNAQQQKECAQHLATLFSTIPEGDILEIGCGTGFLTSKILSTYPNHPFLGIDLAEKMVQECQKRFPGVPFLQCDGETLPFDRKYAAIFSGMTLQWFTDPKLAMFQIKKSLKKGGVFYFSFPNSGSYPEWDFFPLNPLPNIDILNCFETVYHEELVKTHDYATPLEFLIELKNLGVSASTHDKKRHTLLKQLIKDSKCGKMGAMRLTTKITVGYCYV